MAKGSRAPDYSKPLANDRRERFCQYLVDGNSALYAYEKAYNANSETARSGSSRLLTYDDVRGRVKYLRESIAEERAARRRRKLAVCESIWSDESKPEFVDGVVVPALVATSDKLRAIDIDNKMCGDYEPLKLDVSGSQEITVGGLMVEVSPEALDLALEARRERMDSLRKAVKDGR